jgi:hypothetical protein
MRRTISGTILSVALLAQAAGATDWVVKPGAAGGCALESSAEPVPDGYQATTARIRFDGKTVSIVSPSVFDGGSNDIGIAVDADPFVPMDRLADPRTVVFEKPYAELVEQFKRGLTARVQLRFWPTWPATGTHSATFGLIGFTRAHAGLADCK